MSDFITITASGDEWIALAQLSDGTDGWYHLNCSTEGDSKDIALRAADTLLSIFAKGREAFIRCAPEACSDTNFDTKETRHTGYARCSFKLSPGEWQRPDPNQPVSFAGFCLAENIEEPKSKAV